MPSVDWSRDQIPDMILDREAKSFATLLPTPTPADVKKTVTSTMPARVLQDLINQCDQEGITHLSIADLKLALSRWIG